MMEALMIQHLKQLIKRLKLLQRKEHFLEEEVKLTLIAHITREVMRDQKLLQDKQSLKEMQDFSIHQMKMI
jgi:hypothetical protein